MSIEHLLTTLQGWVSFQTPTGILLSLLAVYVGGLLTSFTPCVYPLIPITFSIISSVRGSVWMYGLGFSLAYMLLGAIAIFTGSIFGAVSNTPWIKLLVAIVFAVIGANTLGWVSLPALSSSKKPDLTSKRSVFFLGMMAGFSFSPCVLPVLSVVLLITSKASFLLGMLFMFVYSWGMNTMLLLLGFLGSFLRNKMPKSGRWMRSFEWLLAGLCFIIALYFVKEALSFF